MPARPPKHHAVNVIRYGKKACDRPAFSHFAMSTIIPLTYDPTRGLTYIKAMVGEANYFNSRHPFTPRAHVHRLHGRSPARSHTKDDAVEPIVRTAQPIVNFRSVGLLGGIDVGTGDVMKLESYYPAYSGVLGTGGGHRAGQVISAYDKDTMKELWSFDTGTQFAGNPMTYSVNGKQYIALTLGGRPARDEGSFPEAMALGQNMMLVVFGLEPDARLPGSMITTRTSGCPTCAWD